MAEAKVLSGPPGKYGRRKKWGRKTEDIETKKYKAERKRKERDSGKKQSGRKRKESEEKEKQGILK